MAAARTASASAASKRPRRHPALRWIRASPARQKAARAACLACAGASVAAWLAAALALRRSGNQAFILLGVVCAVALACGLARAYPSLPAVHLTPKGVRGLRMAIACVSLVLLAVWIALDTSRRGASSFVSLGGYAAFILLALVLSNAPRHVVATERGIWPLISGTIAQMTLGILILRTSVGYALFAWLGEQVAVFFEYTIEGAAFVFGEALVSMEGGPALLVSLMGVAFFGAFAELGIHFGITQAVVNGLAYALEISMGISSVEAVTSAANIFVGPINTPQMIKPYLNGLSTSELFCIMTSGYATTAGSIFGAYISFGVSPTHLIAASVVSAPAAILMAKVMHPEVVEEEEKTAAERSSNPVTVTVAASPPVSEEKNDDEQQQECWRTYDSATSAFAAGITDSIPLVLSIVFFVVVFISSINFVDGVLSWLGAMVGAPYLTLEWLATWVMYPFAILMGVPQSDARHVALLLAQKTVVNELYAYRTLGQMIDANQISSRAEVIATWALCGFTNPGTVGITLGTFRTLAPRRAADIAHVVWPSLVAGWLACLSTACIAGWLL